MGCKLGLSSGGVESHLCQRHSLMEIQDFLLEMLLHLHHRVISPAAIAIGRCHGRSLLSLLSLSLHRQALPWMALPPNLALAMVPTAMADGMVMFFLPHGHYMDNHPVQEEVMVKAEGYSVLAFCEIDICIKQSLCFLY